MLRQFHADQLFVVPPGAKFHGERNLHCRADGLKNLPNQRQVAQASRNRRCTSPLSSPDIPRFRSTRSKPRSSTNARRVGHHCGIAAEELRRDGMLVFVKVQIALALSRLWRGEHRRPNVNSVMISPHPPRLRMKRRKTVSVTPAMGASTVAGAISTPPMHTRAGTGLSRSVARAPSPAALAGLSQYLRTA